MRLWSLLFVLLAVIAVPARAQQSEIYYAVKPNPDIAAICAAEDGLAAMWAREPGWN